MRSRQPTDEELRKAYNDCVTERKTALSIGLKDQARTETVKALALWRWIDQRKTKGRK